MTKPLLPVLAQVIADHYGDRLFVLADVLEALADIASMSIAGVDDPQYRSDLVDLMIDDLREKVDARRKSGAFVPMIEVSDGPGTLQ